MTRRWLVPALLAWAVVATVVAALPRDRAGDPPAGRARAGDSLGVDQDPGLRDDASCRQLKRRIRDLEAALTAALTSGAPADSGEPAEAAPIVGVLAAELVLTLMDEARRLEEGDEWTMEAAQALRRRIYALLAADPATHVALARRLRDVPDADAATEVLDLLIENPFARLTRNQEAVDSIVGLARDMLDDPAPFRRAAAMRVLLGYASPTKEDVLLGIGHAISESDRTVRDGMLADLGSAARGRGLTEDEARPLIERLRSLVESPTGAWAAASLAEWSVLTEDFDRIAAVLDQDSDGRRAQDLLNAFRRDTRLAGSDEARARSVLLDVLDDNSRGSNVRSLAHTFLLDYAPWDADTADRVRRYVQSQR